MTICYFFDKIITVLKNNHMTTREEIGKRLKKAREFRGLKLIEASRRAGVRNVSILKYEKGVNQPSIINAIKLANAYQMSLDDIFLPKNVTK